MEVANAEERTLGRRVLNLSFPDFHLSASLTTRPDTHLLAFGYIGRNTSDLNRPNTPSFIPPWIFANLRPFPSDFVFSSSSKCNASKTALTTDITYTNRGMTRTHSLIHHRIHPSRSLFAFLVPFVHPLSHHQPYIALQYYSHPHLTYKAPLQASFKGLLYSLFLLPLLLFPLIRNCLKFPPNPTLYLPPLSLLGAALLSSSHSLIVCIQPGAWHFILLGTFIVLIISRFPAPPGPPCCL